MFSEVITTVGILAVVFGVFEVEGVRAGCRFGEADPFLWFATLCF